jgi:hypothetical protein
MAFINPPSIQRQAAARRQALARNAEARRQATLQAQRRAALMRAARARVAPPPPPPAPPRATYARPHQVLTTAERRAQIARARQPMHRGRRMPFGVRPWALRGSDDGLLGVAGDPVVMYGLLPMGIAVAAGVWMAFH